MLHTKYQSSESSGFRQESVLKVIVYQNRRTAHLYRVQVS